MKDLGTGIGISLAVGFILILLFATGPGQFNKIRVMSRVDLLFKLKYR